MVGPSGPSALPEPATDSDPIPFPVSSEGQVIRAKRMADETASWENLLAGAMARMTTTCMLMPLDTVKTRMQFQRMSPTIRVYNNVYHCIGHILRTEGVLAFYRGVGVKILYKAPAGAVSFGCYELIKHMVNNPFESFTRMHERSLNNPLAPLVLGGLARIIGTAARTPFDIVKQRMQVHGSLIRPDHPALGARELARDMFRNEGMRGIFGGYSVSLLRDLPFGTIYFVSYEALRRAQRHMLNGDDSRLGTLNFALAGGFAGLMATSLTIPFDVVKTRLQVQATLPKEARHYRGMWHAFKCISVEEGLRGLTAGLSARLLYLVPATALTFASYENYVRWLGK